VFTDRLRELGYVEGKTLAIEWRFAEGRFDRLQVLAGELVKANVEVIVTSGTPATSAAKRATATIPIVAMSFGDPVASGFAKSLARPGGNVTGFSTMGGAVYEKRLELLIEALPGATRIGLVVHPDNNFFLRVLPAVEAAAQKLGREILLVNARNDQELQAGIASLATRRAGAVLVADGTFINSKTGFIAGLALKHKLPTVFPILRGVEDGGLIGYASDPKFRYQGAANYVGRILKGEKPAEMPIEQPMKFTLAVNQKTAAALGITIPPAVLARASKVIE
jgi:putative ABC transport system substrate-binding protein